MKRAKRAAPGARATSPNGLVDLHLKVSAEDLEKLRGLTQLYVEQAGGISNMSATARWVIRRAHKEWA